MTHTAEDIFQRLTLNDDPDASEAYRRLLQRGGGDGKPKCARVQYIPFRPIAWPLPKCDASVSTSPNGVRWVFLCKAYNLPNLATSQNPKPRNDWWAEYKPHGTMIRHPQKITLWGLT